MKNDETTKVEEDKKTDANKESDKTAKDETNKADSKDLDNSPKTGDAFDMVLYSLVGLCGLALIVGSGVALKNRKNR